MKTSFKYFALAAIAILLCSCNKEITPDTIESQVQISAKITPCIVTRVTDDGTAFSDGDAIKVQNVDRESRNLATYTYSSSTGKWSTSDELFCNGESENTFNAWYPADAEYSSFIIPSDQTAGIAVADWMTATTSAKQADGNVELSFSHNLAKVTVVIEKWSNEYAANEKVVNSLELNSLSSTMSNDGSLSGDNVAKWIQTAVSQANTSYVALIAPGAYTSSADIMQVYVNGSSTPLKVKTTSAVEVESGKAYSFKLSIGKDLAAISSSVTVGEWDDVALDNQGITAELIKRVDYIDEYGVNHGKGISIGNVMWAPVDCGYHAENYPYGKLYQWGRKYGQGLGGDYDDTILETIDGPATLEVGQNPENADKFILTPNNDWLVSYVNTLWNSGTEESPEKTEYDPCPDGWRVPTKTELENLVKRGSGLVTYNGTSGKYFTGSAPYSETANRVFLQVKCMRDMYDGTQYSKNTISYWTSTPEDNYFACDYKWETSYWGMARAGRGFGLSVRCVQD